MEAIKNTSLYQKLRYRARALKYARKVDPLEISLLRSVLGPGHLALDIGAHKGGYIYWMQKAVTPSGRVLAFEPQRELAEYLERVTDLFGYRNVEIVECAVSNIPGTRPLFSPSTRSSTGATLVEDLFPENDAVDRVNVVTLDGYLARRPELGPARYIKIDVETHELEVLEGGREVLLSAEPVVQFEADQHIYGERPIVRIFEFLSSLGFSGFFFYKKRLRPLGAFDLAVHQPAELRANPNHPAFSNNFFFMKADKQGELLRRYGLSA